MTERSATETRVLLLAPTAKDASASRALLESVGIDCRICRGVDELTAALAGGAGTIVLPEEAILAGKGKALAVALGQQPPWSSLPVVVLTAAGPDSALKVRTILELGEVTLLKRPLEMETFLNAVRAALRDRERQYRIRDQVAELERAQEELRASEEALRDADQKKDDFIALLAHELRNPLAPLRNGLQVMRLAGDRDAEAVVQARAMMERQLTHLVRLVDDLLDVSRISRNKLELRRERVLLADVVSSAVETARPMIEAANHDLQITLPAGPVYLDADLTRLAQVFSNLLTNSAKYTARGGQIRLAAERGADAVVVRVQDNGIGIPAASLENIFDMFSQVDRSIERDTGGLGIGLALVRGLVEMHGGSVAAVSAGQDQGSTFTVRLPLAKARPAPREANGTNGRQPRIRRRVLVVDDNRDGASSMAMMLRLLGNEIRTAHDGIEALEQARAFQPDVILMDLGMPRLNGLEATRRIREQEWGRDVAIIALTGWGQEGDRERSRQAGCNGHLVKPVDLPDLEKLLADVQPKGGEK